MDALQYVAARLWSFYADQPMALLRSLAIACGLVLAVMLLELALVGWQRSSLRRLLRLSNSARTDLLAFVLVETSLGLFIGMAMLLGMTYGLQRMAVAGGAWAGKLTLSSQILALVLYFVVIDFANYWTHRFCHRVPTLWEIHRYHHSAPEMTVLTAARDHPMERALSSAVVAFPAAVLALPMQDFAVVHLLAKTVGLLKHSNLHANWGLVGRYLIQSPAAHWIHHSTDPAHHNKNFASLFQFWDVLFGTAIHPSTSEAERVRLGVDGDNGQAPPFTYLLKVFVASWRRAFGGPGA